MDLQASDLEQLRQLNQSYLDSVRDGDVERFRQLLADDFQASTPAGEILNKTQFLERTAAPTTLRRFESEDIRIRILGDVAIIHAATSYTSLNGVDGRGRYTDDWQKRDGAWVCVSAHVTRLN
jgi:ketosteroid isomerase-like protein